MSLRAVELAEHLQLSKGRISQLVADGRLAGCYIGDGVQRRFDLEKVKMALNQKLDPGQMLGNGAKTRKAIRAAVPVEAPIQKPIETLSLTDPDRYELGRAAMVEEQLRALRLKNGQMDGQYVLASEVEMNVSRLMAQTLAEVDVFLKDVARLVADKMGIDARQVRQLVVQAWRDHRAGQSRAAAAVADVADLTEAEQESQI